MNEKKTWTEGYGWLDATWSFKFKFDTVPIEIGSKIYYELLRSDSEMSQTWNSAGSFWRYEDGFVYQNGMGGVEQIVYNFNLNLSDTFYLGSELSDTKFIVVHIDTIALANGDQKRRWVLHPIDPVNPGKDNTVIWVEDIGSLNGLLSNYNPWKYDSEFSTLLCVNLLDNIVYDSPNFETCWLLPTSLDNVDMVNGLTLYPNPVSGEITLRNQENKIKSVWIFDSGGRLVVEESSQKIMCNDLSPGYYIVVIQFENFEMISKSFVKI